MAAGKALQRQHSKQAWEQTHRSSSFCVSGVSVFMLSMICTVARGCCGTRRQLPQGEAFSKGPRDLENLIE